MAYGAPAQLVHSNVFTGRDITLNQNVSSSRDPMDVLERYVAFGALHDSAERFDPPKCHPGTRAAVQDTIDRWSSGADDSRPIMWLRGAAGAGKSAIAQTLAERWKKNATLAGSFFFFRTAARRNEKRYLIATIVYQLLLSVPDIKPYIVEVISTDFGIFEKSLQSQTMELIAQPLRKLLSNQPERFRPMVIIIDGLDECSLDYPGQNHEAQQREILEAIYSLCTRDLPLRFLIGSRPERQIRASFSTSTFDKITSRTVLDHTHNPDADILLYLRCSFDEIKSLDQNQHLEPDWPPEAALQSLLQKSSGHFVYASTVVRFIKNSRADPKHVLDIVLEISIREKNRIDNPFAELDALYSHILLSVMPASQSIVKFILGDLCRESQIAHLRGEYHTLLWFDTVLLFQSGETYRHLGDLHSVLEIPPPRFQSDTVDWQPIRLTHASMGDFLKDPSRSGSLSIPSRRFLAFSGNLVLERMLTTSLPSTDSRTDFHTSRHYLAQILEHVVMAEFPQDNDLDDDLLKILSKLKLGLKMLVGKGRASSQQYAKYAGEDVCVDAVLLTTIRKNLDPNLKTAAWRCMEFLNTKKLEPSMIKRGTTSTMRLFHLVLKSA